MIANASCAVDNPRNSPTNINRSMLPKRGDMLNVFMCTGFTRDTHQYFMKASPVRPGDFIKFTAQIDLLGALSACPGGDCGSTHSSDTARCYPLKVEILEADPSLLAAWPRVVPSLYSEATAFDDI